jgi:hypothetical protein
MQGFDYIYSVALGLVEKCRKKKLCYGRNSTRHASCVHRKPLRQMMNELVAEKIDVIRWMDVILSTKKYEDCIIIIIKTIYSAVKVKKKPTA